MNVSARTAMRASPPSVATLPGHAAPTRVSLAFVAQRLNLYLRFGRPACVMPLDRGRRVAVFLPGSIFGRIRCEADDDGMLRWQCRVIQACTPLDAMQRIPGVWPGARLLLHAEGERPVRAVLERIDTIEAHGIAACDVSPAYWRALGRRLGARLSPSDCTAVRHAAWRTGRVLQ
ncbi:DUF2840 domain-containing protein [Rhodanobacter sp. Si-c]|uniref:DUF2840 domain-containing protein n=1 Tax=Rhodanobacter lycopersici TaxID=3162487 RepID=A0ABV3Q8X8_9GAMM